MSNKNLLSKKIPYINDGMSIVDAFNNMAKLLNSTFKNKSTSLFGGVEGVDYKLFTGQMNYGGSDQADNYTFNHNFGSIPSEWIVVDVNSDVGASSVYEYVNFIRTSWTSTQISIKLSYKNGAGISIVNFKIKVIK